MQAQSILSLEDFTESRSLRPRKQQQHYDFDFSAGEESDGDPERLALDEEPDTQVAHRSLDVLAGQKPFAPPFHQSIHQQRVHPVAVEEDDDDDASAYAPSNPASSPTEQQYMFSPPVRAAVSSNGKAPRARQSPANEDDDEDFGKRSQAGPARRKNTGRSKKKATNHVKRPPNAFILYRSHACSNNLIPAELRINDHRQISRIVATMWRSLPPEEKSVWEQKAREAKEKHNAEHPEYRYKPTSKSTPRKPRPRKPQVADEDLTEDQLRERRRCEVVAKVILQKKNSPAPPQESNELPSLAALQGGASGTATPEASRASSAPPADDIKARLATEMKKAVEEDRQRREWEEEQRSLGLLPPRPTEPRSRRQRAATVALESSRRAPSAPPIPSPIRAASMDPVYTPGFSGHEHFFRQQQQHHHHRASSWSGSHLLQPFNSDPTDFQFESSYQPYHEESARYEPYSGAEAQWDIRRPSVIFRDVGGLPFDTDDRQDLQLLERPDESFDENAYIDRDGHLHHALQEMTTREVEAATDCELYPSSQQSGHWEQDRMFTSRPFSFEQTTPTFPQEIPV